MYFSDARYGGSKSQVTSLMTGARYCLLAWLSMTLRRSASWS